MLKLIVTGTMGSGKSSVTHILKNLLPGSVEFVDVDKEVHALYSNPEFTQKLMDLFGVQTREDVSRFLFQQDNPEARLRLDDLVTGYLDSLLIHHSVSNKAVVMDIPYYFEMLLKHPESVSNLIREQFTVLTVSMHDEEARYSRIKARAKTTHPDWSDNRIKGILRTQLPSNIKEAMADVVIYNDHDEESLYLAVSEAVALNKFHDRARVPAILFDCPWLSEAVPLQILRVVSYTYAQKRHYHDLSHLSFMLDTLYRSGEQIKVPMLLAILFHDFVYDTTKSDNESESVKSMRSICKLLWPELSEDELLQAEFMIQATKVHAVPESEWAKHMQTAYPCLHEQTSLFLDLDLLILAQGRHKVDEFEWNIRKEYSLYSEEEYKAGRTRVLQTFLERGALYHSDLFGTAQNEECARQSLGYLIEKNKEGI